MGPARRQVVHLRGMHGSRQLQRLWLALTLQTLLVLTLACDEQASTDPNVSVAPVAKGLPDLELRDDTKNLLLTWVDPKGDFKVSTSIAAVPEAAREQVRVVITTREDGTGDTVYVADLRKLGSDGTYPIKTMSRSQWDEIGASKRRARLEALAPAASASPSGAPPLASALPGSSSDKKKIHAIVYGADWCKPCHAAEDYLKKKGVVVIKKDVDKDASAAQEMRRKLNKAGMGTASIPIIDIMGRILVGYSPRALDRTVDSIRRSETL